MTLRYTFIHLFWVFFLATGASALQINPAASVDAATRTVSEPSAVPEERQSAQAAMRTFLEAMKDSEKAANQDRLLDAAACLDLSEIPAAVRKEVGVERAVMLKEILDRVAYIEWWNIPDATDAASYSVAGVRGGKIEISPTDSGEWLFTEETVANIPDLYRRYEEKERVVEASGSLNSLTPSLWLRSKFPKTLREGKFILEYWQWISLAVVILAGYLISQLTGPLVNYQFQRRFQRVEGWNRLKGSDKNVGRPVGIFILTLLWASSLPFLGLPPLVYSIFLVAVQVMAGLAVISIALKIINLITDVWAIKAEKTETRYDDLLVPLLRRTLKTLVFVATAVVVAENVEADLTGLIAGLGLGGLAFALAAQDILSNVFGSVTVLLDRPFHIGDWVVIGDIEGTIEEVGFRSTRVRTFYNSLVTIPNSKLTTTPVDNYGARRYRRAKTFLSLTYDTPPAKIEAFCEGIRELVRSHPDTRKDYYQVYFNEFNASSLDVLLYIFFETPDWGKELESRHEFYLAILKLAEELGVEFAFPTQTIHLHKEEGGGDENQEPLTFEKARQSGIDAAREISEAWQT